MKKSKRLNKEDKHVEEIKVLMIEVISKYRKRQLRVTDILRPGMPNCLLLFLASIESFFTKHFPHTEM